MHLAYKEDMDRAQEYFKAFWENDCIDRPAMFVTAPREKPIPGPPGPEPPADMPPGVAWEWCNKLDVDFRIAVSDARMRTTFYGGEAVPALCPETGPGCIMTFFGSQPTFQYDTAWFSKIKADWETYQLPCCDTCEHWEKTLQIIRTEQAFFEGKALVMLTDLGDSTGSLTLLRGKEEFYYDVTDESKREMILRARDQVIAKWIECYHQIFPMVKGPELGSIDWEGVWAPGRMYTVQSDTSVMLSPATFDWLVAPELERLCEFLDYSLFHLDSPGYPQHIDRLLRIPSLNAIEWGPGFAKPLAVDWIPLLKKIQAGGKALVISDHIGNVERLVRELKPEGLLIRTGAKSEEEAKDLLRLVKDWTKAR